MNRKKSKSLRDLLSDRFSGTWQLLSETSQFLSRTPVFAHYEDQLRVWRRDLQNADKGGEVFRQIRDEITELRSFLREQGYDLSLAKQSIVLDGFRNDASLGEGFRRVVLFFADDDIYWLSGEDNHITLAELLERQLESRFQQRRCSIRSRHYLWYRRRGNDLDLAGSDTETKEDFERFKMMVSANSLVILAKLRGLK
ncbi:hypothetical protein AGMMS50230_17930 [Spirochaetia bacterium]|nr:hypothetical protein AGMMS50230_17930 [Spirochaetia bacterium]